jgi:hypothetical protein
MRGIFLFSVAIGFWKNIVTTYTGTVTSSDDVFSKPWGLRKKKKSAGGGS